MTSFRCLASAGAALLVLGSPTSGAPPAREPAAIELDSPWRKQIYDFAREKLVHPAWGWRHSERDYLLAVEIARREHLAVDLDVLFAAAFLHDVGVIAPFARAGIDHADRSAELAEPRLREAGFPMAKFPAVRAAIVGHMYDRSPGLTAEAKALHDADTLDFLGATGVARRLAVTGEAPDLDAGLARIDAFAQHLTSRLVTAQGRRAARERVRTMRRFLRDLELETPARAKP